MTEGIAKWLSKSKTRNAADNEYKRKCVWT